MKKKFLAIYALAGALVASPVFTSCVDDKESDSVTAVRNAKAEQLKALAALSNAQAEAQKITAEAQAALNNAKAEYKKNQTEQEKQTFAIKLESIKAQAEAALLSAKNQAAMYEQQLIQKAESRITTLYTNYKTHSDNIISYNQDIMNKTADIAKLEAKLLSVQAFVKEETAKKNREIAANEAKIAILKEATGVDKDALTTQAAELKQKYDLAKNDLENNEGAALAAANKAVEEALKNTNASNSDYTSSLATVEAVKELNELAYSTEVQNDLGGYHPFVTTDKSDLYILVQEFVVKYQNIQDNKIKMYQNEIGTEQDAKDPNGTLYAQLAAAKEELATANALPASDTSKDSQVKAANEKIASINDLITAKNKDMNDVQSKLDDFNKLIATFSGADYEAYQKEVAEVAKLEEAVEAAELAYEEAAIEVEKIKGEYDAVNSLSNDGISISDEIAKCETAIADAKSKIANLKKEMERVQTGSGTETWTDENGNEHTSTSSSWHSIWESEASMEAAIAYAKAEIENLKAKVEIETALAAKAKKELDAALAE